MTTMRERAIEAARIVISDNQDASINYVATAAYDAILTMLMEPSEEMISAGIIERHDQPCPEAWNLATVNIWEAMLKAASA